MKKSDRFWDIRQLMLVISLILSVIQTNAQSGENNIATSIFMNPSLPVEIRVKDLVSQMTIEEKIRQMQYNAPSIPRLGIPEYNWWNECLHGVARNGIATVFPQAIGMAATWNTSLIFTEADVISTEARAKYYEAIGKNQHGIYQGLTFWSPNINIFRDPRWGRGQETYGEDPFLTAEIGKAFVKGLQGNDPKYFKVISTAKHFAVHSGPEPDRHKFDAWPTQRDLYDTYLPAFEALVKEAGVYSVMSCYNRLNATPSSASEFLLDKTLRQKWGFKGYVVSDCWAVSDMFNFHKFVPDAAKASTLAVRAGCDLACGNEYEHLIEAYNKGYITDAEIDQAVSRIFEARMRLGLFDPATLVSYASIAPEANNTEKNRQLARKVACESIVLLKNENKVLPISPKIKSIAVIGPYANDTSVLLGNYNGIPSDPVTILKGMTNRAGKRINLRYARGVAKPEVNTGMDSVESNRLMEEALVLASKSQLIIFAGGISPELEGEEMPVKVDGFSGGDRTNLEMPAEQMILLKKLKQTGKPIVLVLTNGSALAVNWALENIDAIVEAWYPGEEGGNAVADVLFGDYNPAGRLPVTFYKSVNDLPAFDDYSMQGRTYRYLKSKPLYAFGYGKSYSVFEYSDLKMNKTSAEISDTVTVSVNIRNIGLLNGDEVVQLYIKQPSGLEGQPLISLKAFERKNIQAGKTSVMTVKFPVSKLRHFEPKTGDYQVAKGTYQILVGAASDDIRLRTELKVE